MYIYMYIYIYINLSLFATYCYIMDKLEPPQSFSFEGNVSQSWRLWLKHFEFYVTATEKDGKNDKVDLRSSLNTANQERTS